MTIHQRSRMLAAMAVDGPMTAATQADLDAHLASCVACRTTVLALRLDAVALRDRARLPAPLAMRGRVLTAALARHDQDRRTGLRLLVLVALLVGGLATFSLAAGRRTSDQVMPPVLVPEIGTATTFGLSAGTRGVGSCSLLVDTACATSTLAAFGGIWTTTTDAIVRVDDEGTTVAEIATAGVPIALTTDGSSVWATTRGPSAVLRIDPAEARVAASYGLPGLPAGITVADGRLWIADEQHGVVAIDPSDGSQSRDVPLDGGAWSVTTTAGAVWAADRMMTRLTRIDPRTGRPQAVAVALPAPENAWDYGGGVVAEGDRLWLLSGHEVDRYDPSAGTRAGTVAPIFPHIAADATAVWVVGGTQVVRWLDPASLETIAEKRLPMFAPIGGGEWEVSMALTPEALWVRSAGDGRLIRIARDG